MHAGRRRIHLGQLVIADAALVGMAVAAVGPAWLWTGVAAVAVAVCVATFGRTGGRWWYQAAASHRRYARRRRRAAADVVAGMLAARTPSALVWLRTLAPELTVRPVRSMDTVVGIGADGGGWFGAVAIDPDPSGLPGLPAPAELAALIEPGGDRRGLSRVQVVRRGVQTWVALRLSPVDAVAVALAGGVGAGGMARVEAVVAAGVARAAMLLRRHGYCARVLDPDRLLAALVAANGLDAPPQEQWSMWRSGTLAHTTYAASRWPPEPVLAAPGVWAVTASFARSATFGCGADARRRAHAQTGVLVRVAAEPAVIGRACREVVRAAARAGVRLRRLDGDQAPAAYACGPSGTASPAM